MPEMLEQVELQWNIDELTKKIKSGEGNKSEMLHKLKIYSKISNTGFIMVQALCGRLAVCIKWPF